MLSGSWNSQGDGRDALEFRLQDDLHLHGVDQLWRVLIVRLALQAEIPNEFRGQSYRNERKELGSE